MASDLLLRRKWTLQAHDRRIVLVKKLQEGAEHVLMKAFLWALYLPQYPDLEVEISIGDRYKPDVIMLDPFNEPLFWGEAGQVSPEKVRSLARRYRRTHFALAKWDTPLKPFVDIVSNALSDLHRSAPFDLICFPDDSAERFIDPRGQIQVSHDDLQWIRL